MNEHIYQLTKDNFTYENIVIAETKRLEFIFDIINSNLRKNKRIGREGFSKNRKIVLMRDLYTCQSCGYQNGNGKDIPLHVDHIIPIKYGGTSNLDNLQVLCQKCNLSKRDKI